MVTNAVTPDQLGGLQRYVRELSAALVAQGWPVAIVTKRASPDLPRREIFTDGVRMIRISAPDRKHPLYAALYPLMSVMGATREARRAPGLVHVHFPLQGVGAVLAGDNYVHTFHAPVHKEVVPERTYATPHTLLPGLVAGARAVEGRVARAAAESIVLTEFTRSELSDLAPDAAMRAHLIPAGLDSHRFQPGAPVDHAAAQGPGPLLFTARRLVPRTGVAELVAAMPSILTRLPQARLVIAGDGQLRGAIETRIRELGLGDCVQLVGRVSDDALVQWYRAATLFVLPTQELEGFGMSTVEALACGTVAVGTPAGGTPEVLGGLDSQLVARDTSPGALADVIVRTLSDPDRFADIVRRARSYVVPRLDWTTIAQRHIEVYERLYAR
jgi:glycosyltransferase involved in cell wall biosynthesis